MRTAARKLFCVAGAAFALGAAARADEAAAGTPAGAEPPAHSFAALVKNSPFKATAKNRVGGNAPAASRRLRFVGMLTVEGQTAFGLYDDAAQRSFWLGARETNDAGIFVEGFDAERRTLAVRVGAERLTIPLAKPEEKPLAIQGATYAPAQRATTQTNAAAGPRTMQSAARVAPAQPAQPANQPNNNQNQAQTQRGARGNRAR
ncbi:MAG: hypothetical protein ACI4QA_05240 [Candidatus Spyradosoma sp.]